MSPLCSCSCLVWSQCFKVTNKVSFSIIMENLWYKFAMEFFPQKNFLGKNFQRFCGKYFSTNSTFFVESCPWKLESPFQVSTKFSISKLHDLPQTLWKIHFYFKSIFIRTFYVINETFFKDFQTLWDARA